MLSLKDTLRKLIVTATLAAVTTHFFTGCSNTPVTSSDLYAPELTYEVEAPPLTYEANPGINSIEATDSDSFSIKYKYWYDNPEVKESQEQSLAEANPTPGALTDKDFLNLPNLPIYRDSVGNEYIISGRTKVYLADGKISGIFMYMLRAENTGDKIFTLFDMSKSKLEDALNTFKEKLNESEIKQPQTYDERVSSVDVLQNSTEERELFINNIQVKDADDLVVTVSDKVNLGTIFAAQNNGYFEVTGNGYEITLYTAAGIVKITATTDDNDCYTLEYSTNIENAKTKSGEVILDADGAIFSLAALEKYLGFDVEYYETFVNIVTDNRDIPLAENVITYDEAISVVDNEVDTDTSADSGNPMPASKPVETKPEDNKEDEKPINPAGTKSSDGKYILTETDIENPDGTYSATVTSGCTDPGDDSTIDADTYDYLKSVGLTESNPSKIPYSQITIGNAAEAFPYLGWIGSIPDYVEVEPGMTDEEIKEVISMNFVGHNYKNTNNHTVSRDATPRFFFKSEAEYNQYLADEAAKAAAIDQRDQEAREEWEKIKNGEATIGGNGSEDFYNDLLNSR